MPQQPNKAPQPKRKQSSTLAAGIALLVAGAVLLAVNLGYRIPYLVWEYWPLALMAAGVLAMVFPSRHLSRSGGVWLLAVGAYAEISLHGYFGLGWGSAWPIFLIAAGLEMILDRRKGDDEA